MNNPEAVLMAHVQSMPERVAPRCEHFGACGGCQLQDVPQEQQLAVKRTMLQEMLQGAGVARLPEIQLHAANPWRYRNRVRFRVQDRTIGYSRRASNEFLAIEECPILSPLVWHAADLVKESLCQYRAAWPQSTEAVELLANSDDSALQLSLHLDATVSSVDRDAPRLFRTVCEELHGRLPQLVGAGLSVAADTNPALRKRLQESQRAEIARWGEPALNSTVGNYSYRISRNAFFQVNRFLTAEMVRHVVADHHGAIAFDLFAGAGLFSVPLTERFEQVIAVEIAEPAASDLTMQLQVCGPQHRAVHTTVEDFLSKHPLARANQPDLIVLDPPRAGINIATTNALLHTGAKAIVYVSCNAATFARDARPLIQSGYTLDSLHLFDLFPQTFHTETVAVFRR